MLKTIHNQTLTLFLVLAVVLVMLQAPFALAGDDLLQVKRPPAIASEPRDFSPEGRSYDIVSDLLSRGVDSEGRKVMVVGDVSFYLAADAKFYSRKGEEIAQNLFKKRCMVGLMLDKQEQVTAVYLLSGESS